MDEKKAKKLLGKMIKSDGSIDVDWCSFHYCSWTKPDPVLKLDGIFSIEQLNAIVWWVNNKK